MAKGMLKDGSRCLRKPVLPSCTTEEIPFLKKDYKTERLPILNYDLNQQGIDILEPFRRLSL